MVGGPAKAASVCDVSVRAVYKWLAAGALPRTEYTGETDYIGKMAVEAEKVGSPFDPAAVKAGLIGRRTAGRAAA